MPIQTMSIQVRSATSLYICVPTRTSTHIHLSATHYLYCYTSWTPILKPLLCKAFSSSLFWCLVFVCMLKLCFFSSYINYIASPVKIQLFFPKSTNIRINDALDPLSACFRCLLNADYLTAPRICIQLYGFSSTRIH